MTKTEFSSSHCWASCMGQPEAFRHRDHVLFSVSALGTVYTSLLTEWMNKRWMNDLEAFQEWACSQEYAQRVQLGITSRCQWQKTAEVGNYRGKIWKLFYSQWLFSSLIIQPKVCERFWLWSWWRHGLILALVCVCVYKLLVCLIHLVYSCGNFLKVMDFARFGENCLSAYMKTVFSTCILSWSLTRVNVVFHLLGLFSILFLDVKVTCNCHSLNESWKNDSDS